MNENKAVPNIRFNDFENKWEKEKLNQIVKKVTRKNSKLQTSLSLTISAECGIINQNLFFNRQIASRDMSNYFLIKQGEFAYNKSYSKSAPFGTIKRLNRYNQGALSSLYIVFCPTKVDSDYLVSYFDSSYWYKQLSMISTEGVRNHGLLNVSPNDFFDMNLSIPYDDKEQQKIGDFFSRLDKLLDLQQQKIDKLELLKKALLQKLFPKHDAKIPELRFKGCDGEWEDCLVGNLLEVVPNKEYITEASKKGLNPVIQQGEKPILGFSNKAPYKEYKKVVLFGDHTVSLYKPESPFLIATDGIKILYVKDWNGHFLFAFLQKYKPDSEGYKRHFSILKSKKAKFTIIDEEQQKIGNFLSKVDQLIELENKKLQNFQQVKKCLLQNMFVE
ncbi:restriction endonuclease subunit S [Lactobacillus apis]|uniref:restriction endonuclease subunit S n=1 Tax=Lactobacillus apis TaxID=303541 RepID=UPI00243287C8|nr:restriction endonuclease subunit S [Lactobacillus apis]